MPELPDVIVYREALERSFGGRRIARVDLKSPFVVWTFELDLLDCSGMTLAGVQRLGKRLVWRLETPGGEPGPLIVFHLMIAGRFHQKKAGRRPKARTDLAALHFDEPNQEDITATLTLTEAMPQ